MPRKNQVIFWTPERMQIVRECCESHGIPRGVEVAAERLTAMTGKAVTPASCRLTYYRKFLDMQEAPRKPTAAPRTAGPLPPHKKRVDPAHMPPSCAELRRRREAEGRPYAPAQGGVWQGFSSGRGGSAYGVLVGYENP